MPFLLFVLSVLGGLTFWYFRLKKIGKAGAEIADVAGTLRGKYRRNQMRNKSAQSPVTAIDDPIIAAATLVRMLIVSDTLAPKQMEYLQNKMQAIASPADAEEAVVYGDWVYSQKLNTNNSVKIICGKLNNWLNSDEREELANIIRDIESSDLFVVSEQFTQDTLQRLY